jgi:ABC-2 type transport system ATP-binding protein
MEALFREEIRREKAAGRSVLLSSHILSEVEALADRISIIRQGRVVETGTLEQMRTHARTNVAATLDDASGQAAALSGVPGVEDLHVEDHRVRFSIDADGLGPAMNALAARGVRALTVTPPSLEDLFLQHYGDRIPQADRPKGGEETHDGAARRRAHGRHRGPSPGEGER